MLVLAAQILPRLGSLYSQWKKRQIPSEGISSHSTVGVEGYLEVSGFPLTTESTDKRLRQILIF